MVILLCMNGCQVAESVYFIRMEHMLNHFIPLFQETTVTTEFQANFTLDVMPFTSYSLTVKTRPKEGGFWSDPSTVHFRSQPAGLLVCLLVCLFSHVCLPYVILCMGCHLMITRPVYHMIYGKPMP